MPVTLPAMEQDEQPVEVPVDAIAPDVLQALLEEFVTRDGTDYGERERSLEEKVATLRASLARGDARIVFDPATESVTVVLTREL